MQRLHFERHALRDALFPLVAYCCPFVEFILCLSVRPSVRPSARRPAEHAALQPPLPARELPNEVLLLPRTVLAAALVLRRRRVWEGRGIRACQNVRTTHTQPCSSDVEYVVVAVSGCLLPIYGPVPALRPAVNGHQQLHYLPVLQGGGP